MAIPAFQQKAFVSGSSSCAYASDNLAGSLLVCLGYFTNNGASTFSDTNNGAWTEFSFSPFNSGASLQQRAFYFANAKAGPNTVSFSRADATRLVIAEWTGVKTISPIDVQTAAATGPGNTDPAAPILTVPAGHINDLILFFASQGGAATSVSSTGGGFTLRAFDTAINTCDISDQVGSAGTFTGSQVWASKQPWGAASAAFLNNAPTGGGGSSSWLTVALANSLRGLRH